MTMDRPNTALAWPRPYASPIAWKTRRDSLESSTASTVLPDHKRIEANSNVIMAVAHWSFRDRASSSTCSPSADASTTRRCWAGVELASDSRGALYIPPGCAAGYQALEDNAEVLYLVSGFYAPSAERGVRLDDPSIAIEWPLSISAMSEKDSAWPLLA